MDDVDWQRLIDRLHGSDFTFCSGVETRAGSLPAGNTLSSCYAPCRGYSLVGAHNLARMMQYGEGVACCGLTSGILRSNRRRSVSVQLMSEVDGSASDAESKARSYGTHCLDGWDTSSSLSTAWGFRAEPPRRMGRVP